MRRRDFICLLGGVAAWPLSAHAQQRPARIGFLTRKTDASVASQIDAFRQALQALGWVEGKTITIQHRDAGGEVDRLGPLAAELVAQYGRLSHARPTTDPSRSTRYQHHTHCHCGLD